MNMISPITEVTGASTGGGMSFGSSADATWSFSLTICLAR